jgi:hypothetical protein
MKFSLTGKEKGDHTGDLLNRLTVFCICTRITDCQAGIKWCMSIHIKAT